MIVNIALCGLATRLARTLEIAINSNGRNLKKFHVGADEFYGPQIAIVDADSQTSLDEFHKLRRSHPQAIEVTISDHGLAGSTPYRIQRKSLFVQIVRVLNEIIDNELTGSRVSSHRAFAPHPVATIANAEPAAASSQDVFVAGNAGPSCRLTALVVDDSLAVRTQLCEALKRLGIASDQAENAESAAALLARNRYSLAFLDVVMPGADGYQICRKIKHDRTTRKMPVLMLTSRSSPFDRARGALAGCDSYLTKPITWETFSQAVGNALKQNFNHDQIQPIAYEYRV